MHRATDAVAEMPLVRSHLGSEPEEVNVASGVVAMGRSGVAGPPRVRRQNAYATLCANHVRGEGVAGAASFVNRAWRVVAASSPRGPR
jgi:hypothetical protein